MTAAVPGLTETDLKKIVLAIQQLAAGRSNATGQVTLTVSAATTVVVPKQSGTIAAQTILPSGLVDPPSQVILTPLTANAAAEVGNGTIWISSVTKDTFTITHANSATTGRTFAYAILG